jgi:D-beta-D-heptose 7-phosphate kinase/D-beta-D-heptose 1-phosphate adenosyltransferase
MSKQIGLKSLLKIISKARQKNKRIVFTNGCFDILHSGHIKVFKEAKQSADILVLGLNSDKSIKSIKGNLRPIVDEKSRISVLSAISFIDYIVVFNEDTPFELIKTIKPDVLVKGGDWDKGKIVGAEFAGKIKRIKLDAGKSTSNIIEKILKVYGKENR